MYKKAAKNISYIITMIIVFILVFVAIYFNLNKFLPSTTIKYTQINIENGTSFNDILSEYTSIENREAFIAEVKKINKLDDIESIERKSLIIPVKN
ncbi:hypothetical protein LLG07_08430 [bacterium]|nr:hypothetical protein [bacterium]